jgi:hypothetical protein
VLPPWFLMPWLRPRERLCRHSENHLSIVRHCGSILRLNHYYSEMFLTRRKDNLA